MTFPKNDVTGFPYNIGIIKAIAMPSLECSNNSWSEHRKTVSNNFKFYVKNVSWLYLNKSVPRLQDVKDNISYVITILC